VWSTFLSSLGIRLRVTVKSNDGTLILPPSVSARRYEADPPRPPYVARPHPFPSDLPFFTVILTPLMNGQRRRLVLTRWRSTSVFDAANFPKDLCLLWTGDPCAATSIISSSCRNRDERSHSFHRSPHAVPRFFFKFLETRYSFDFEWRVYPPPQAFSLPAKPFSVPLSDVCKPRASRSFPPL